MTQLTLNAKVLNMTKTTSFFANFGRESNLFGRPRNQISTKAAITKWNTIRTIQKNILKMQRSSTIHQNKKRKMTLLLKEGNKVYLLTKNLKINRKRSKKLNHVKIESFFIKSVKGRVNYELNLSIDAKIFLVFHTSILEFAHSNTSIQITFRYKSQEDQEYEVEQILRQEGQQYLVKWKRYSTSKNTWESKKNLTNCSKELKRFQRANQKMWKINCSKYLREPLVSTKCRWWTLMAKEHALLNLTLQCFVASHSSSFVARFRRTPIVEPSDVASRLLRGVLLSISYVALQVDDIDWCQGEPSRKCSQDERISGTCSNHRQSCMLFPSENNGSKDALRGHRYQALPRNYIYVGTTFSFVWAWPMIKKKNSLSRREDLKRDLVLRTRQGVMGNTTALRTHDTKRVLEVLKDWAGWASKCSRSSRIEQTKQVDAQEAQGTKQIEQSWISSCI